MDGLLLFIINWSIFVQIKFYFILSEVICICSVSQGQAGSSLQQKVHSPHMDDLTYDLLAMIRWLCELQ